MSHAYSAKNLLDDFDKTDWLIFVPRIFIEYFPLHRCLILLSNICPDLLDYLSDIFPLFTNYLDKCWFSSPILKS